MATALEWKTRIQEQKQSGLSIPDWCRSNGVSITTFYNWQKKLKTTRSESNTFINLNPPTYLEIEIDKRVTIKLPSNFDSIHLKQVLEVFGC